jgi:hypothetical protein
LVLDVVDRKRLEQLVREKLSHKIDGRKPGPASVCDKLTDVQKRAQNLLDSVERGMDFQFVKDRLDDLSRERLGLESQKIALEAGGKNPGT